jgi:NDP-sugar pyrophosphorylase family protein
MKYAILAAGNGSRLMQEGELTPKPLVKVGGEALIDRLLRVFMANDATEIAVICNSQMTAVVAYLETLQKAGDIPLRLMVKSTPSSMHSLWELRQWLEDAPFILTTVDTIFHEQEFAEYVHAFRSMMTQTAVDGLMGVTDYIDDERPLYVDTDDMQHITGFTDNSEHPHYVSAGIYGLTPRCFDSLGRCMDRGEQRMRNFQRSLVNEGFRLKAWPFSKVLDIDHVSDVQKAEKFLSV